MKIIEIKKSELISFLQSDNFKKSKNLPITSYRAFSQVNNPRAKDDDIILIIALDIENQVVGYIGALPELIPEYPDVKLAWNSCWWIDKYSSSNVAMKLLFKFISVWKSNVMMRDLTTVTKKIILSIKGFSVLKSLNGKKYFIRLNITDKFSDKIKILRPFFRFTDFIFNCIMDIFFYLIYYKNNIKSNVYIEFSNYLSSDDSAFIKKLNKNEIFKRDITELNWILKFPWIIQSSEKDINYKKYYFSSIKKTFSSKVLYIKNIFTNDLIAILIIKEINGCVEIPYLFYEKGNLEIIAQNILNYLIKEKAVSFLTFNDEINNWFEQKRLAYFFMKKIEKEFVVSDKLKHFIKPDFKFQDGEGDYVFA
jgi:hypothetical protein